MKRTWLAFSAGVVATLISLAARPCHGGDAPAWMHTAAVAPLPKVEPKDEAVVIYSEDITIVESATKIRKIERRAYKILRPEGRQYGIASAYYGSNEKILGMRGWCIPAQGKDYEVRDKEAVEISLGGVEYSELVTDTKEKRLKIPAADPGNVVGYEIESEEHPYLLQDWWYFQWAWGVPLREARYTLQLPPGWEYKARWLNHAEVSPTPAGPNQWQWVVTDVGAVHPEQAMPPQQGFAGQMLISLFPPGASEKRGFDTWADMGRWDAALTQGRREASPEMKKKVAELSANSSNSLAKMQALAAFVQHDIRYVAIELGIGGWQPHSAADTFARRYGDCKDKATLTSAMLKEIGIDSYYIIINSRRGAVNAQSPPQPYWFNHAILAVRLPEDVKDPSLLAVYSHPTLGRMLIFDPTDDLTPFGQLRGPLQANYGLLVTPDGGDLVKMPELSPNYSGVRRSAKFTQSLGGTLSGNVVETYVGDDAARERAFQQTVNTDQKRIERIESTLSHSLGTFQITKASAVNVKVPDQPFQYIFTFSADNYARTAGSLLLVRPHVLGSWSSDIMESKEPRKYPVEFRGPEKDTDTYEITLAPGYEVDDLPPPVDADYSFGSYHSRTEAKGNVLTYSRTMEIKELSVPVDKLDQLKSFYRAIAGDERNTAVLKPSGK
jgi:Domain of Unknown Function with PDB structure (DUF3857)/Transglutaminase-like superfamily